MQVTDRQWIVVLTFLALVAQSCAARSGPHPDMAASASAEQHIVSLVHEWFAVLEQGTLESHTLDGFVAEPSFELSLIGGDVESLTELEAWRAKLSSSHLELGYQIGSVDVESVGEDLHRARFEFERRAVDDEGLPHIARREHVWLVRNVPGAAPVVLRIDERPLLAFPGTGPQIVCY